MGSSPARRAARARRRTPSAITSSRVSRTTLPIVLHARPPRAARSRANRTRSLRSRLRASPVGGQPGHRGLGAGMADRRSAGRRRAPQRARAPRAGAGRRLPSRARPAPCRGSGTPAPSEGDGVRRLLRRTRRRRAVAPRRRRGDAGLLQRDAGRSAGARLGLHASAERRGDPVRAQGRRPSGGLRPVRSGGAVPGRGGCRAARRSDARDLLGVPLPPPSARAGVHPAARSGRCGRRASPGARRKLRAASAAVSSPRASSPPSAGERPPCRSAWMPWRRGSRITDSISTSRTWPRGATARHAS